MEQSKGSRRGMAMPQVHGPYFNAAVETMSADEITSMQSGKLCAQLEYLKAHSPFHAKKLSDVDAEPGDIRSVADLARLPFTEKAELRESQARHPPLGSHAAAAMEEVVRVHASSGTTGTPSFVGVTNYDKKRWTECIARGYWAQGLRPASVFAMGLSIGFFVGGLPVAAAVEAVGATLLPIGVGPSDRLIASIRSMNADVLATTPSYAIYLAELARTEFGVDTAELGIKRVMVGAEPGGGIPEIRAQIEEAWNARCTEAIGIADLITIHSAECDAQDGCHFMVPDYMVMEIIDPDTGNVITPDEPKREGELVFTHLDRQCHPMLRFRTRDRVVVKTTPCACGRTGPRLRCIGRTDDMLIVRGVNVWPSAVKDVVAGFRPEVSGEMLIAVEGAGPTVEPPLRIMVETSSGSGADNLSSLAARLEQALRAKLIFSAKVELVPPGVLPRTQMKAKLVERNLH